MRKSILLVAAAAGAYSAQGQFTNGCFTIGGPQFDLARSVVQTSDGGYAIAGATYSFSTDPSDENMYVVKTDASGVVEWNRGYGDPGPGSVDFAADLIQTSDGGFAVTGPINSFNMGLMKLDAAGTVEWSMKYDTYGTDGVDDPYAVVQTPDGGYLLTGSGSVASTGSIVMVVIKTDENGTIEWSKAFEGAFGTQEAYDGVVATGGGYAICGYHLPESFLVLRLDDAGELLWRKSYGTGFQIANALAATPDSGFVVTGLTRTFGFSSVPDQQDDGFVVKVDKDGELEWARAFGTDSLSEEFKAVVPTSDGGYAMTGQAAEPPFGVGGPKIYVAKCDANGILQWSQQLGAVGQGGVGWEIVECTDGGLAVTGSTAESGNVQCMFMKMEADGSICPTCGVTPHGADSAAVFSAATLTTTVHDSVATATLFTVTDHDGVSATMGCLETSVGEPARTYGQLELSPNPAMDLCTVMLPEASGTDAIELISLQGSTLLVLPSHGQREMNIPLHQLAPGSYILRTRGSVPERQARLVVGR